jgi:prophage tail gpP-like protein/phage tail protein X
MSSVAAREGETFDTISRRAYGVESYARAIAFANPSLSEPLAAGAVVNLPALPTAGRPPTDVDGDLATITVGGRVLAHWTDITVTRALDSIDTFEFAAPFDPESRADRDAFAPFRFQPTAITVGGARLFTGVLVRVQPEISPDGTTVTAGGYSRAGVLGDCNPSPASYPLEFNGMTLREIAHALAEPFGVPVAFTADAGPVFDRVACGPTVGVWSFLVDLAKQRGGVFSSAADGSLEFIRPTPAGVPVARLAQGRAPLVGVSPQFDPQQYFSDVTALAPKGIGLAGGQYTAKNERLTGVIRPYAFQASDTAGGDIQTAATAKLGRMFTAATYRVEVATWRTPAGNVWAPGDTVELTAPGAMVYKPFLFKIRGVTLRGGSAGSTAELELIIPESFTRGQPERLPWE